MTCMMWGDIPLLWCLPANDNISFTTGTDLDLDVMQNTLIDELNEISTWLKKQTIFNEKKV